MTWKRFWMRLALLALIGGALGQACCLAFVIGKDSGLYPEIEEMALVTFWFSGVALFVVTGLAISDLVRTIRTCRG